MKAFPETMSGVSRALPDDELSPRQEAMAVFIESTKFIWDPNEHEKLFVRYLHS